MRTDLDYQIDQLETKARRVDAKGNRAGLSLKQAAQLNKLRRQRG
jgi:hypothetical protein